MKQLNLLLLVGALSVAAMWSQVLAPDPVKRGLPYGKEIKVPDEEQVPDDFPKEVLRKPLMPLNVVKTSDRVAYALASAVVPTKKNKGKYVAITDVVKDKRMLDFICHNQVLARAHWVEKKTGLSTATVLGQKYSESGGGTSKFCAKTKNLSNIKCTKRACKKYNVRGLKRGQTGSTSDHCIQLYDDVPSDRFVRFSAMYKGWEQYVDLINKRYHKAAAKTNVLDEVKGLKAAGFATNPRYVKLVYGKITGTGLLKLQDYINKGYSITTTDGRYILLQQ